MYLWRGEEYVHTCLRTGRKTGSKEAGCEAREENNTVCQLKNVLIGSLSLYVDHQPRAIKYRFSLLLCLPFSLFVLARPAN